MQTFDQSLFSLYKSRTDHATTRRCAAPRNPDEFKLKIQGIQSTSDASREEMESRIEMPGGDLSTGSPFEIERIEGPKG